MAPKNLSGKEFGLLTAINYHPIPCGKKKSRSAWLCRCACGGESIVITDNLVSGRTQSCGCFHDTAPIKHANHGSPAYKSWYNMLSRCKNRKATGYETYGGRDILVCPEWHDFAVFYRDMGDRPQGTTLDRIDTNGAYCEENCRWADIITQANNTRGNTLVEYQGEVKTKAQWATHFGVDKIIFSARLYQGWSIERAVQTPIARRKEHKNDKRTA